MAERYWRCEFGHRFAVDPESETCPDRDHDGSWCGAPLLLMPERFWARTVHVARAECVCGWWVGGDINAWQARAVAERHADATGHPVSVVLETHEVLRSAVPEAS